MEQGMFQWNTDWDGRESEKSNDLIHRYVYLVRHGKYVRNPDGQDVLSPIGMRQATVTGRRLNILSNMPISLTHSTLQRAVETTSLMRASLEGITSTESDLLCEGTLTNTKVSNVY